MTKYKLTRNDSAFTIVELLVVIVIIGILAAITIVAYTGISQRATVAALTSDLTNASTQLKLFQVTNSIYPATIDCSQPNSSTNQCIKASSGATFSYTPNNVANPPTFSLTETASNGTTVYNVTDSTAVTVYTDPWVTNWYPGIAATALAGKHVYKTDLSVKQYKTTATFVTSPQGAIGLDPDNPSSMSLVSPQTNPGVDFSAYPAQNECKAIGGRLPNVQELSAIYVDRDAYGYFENGGYWSSTELIDVTFPAFYAITVDFIGDMGPWGSGKTGPGKVRCISD